MFAFADVKQALIQWQERIEFAHKLLTLLNSYSPPELRNACIGKSWPCRTCPAQAPAVRWKCHLHKCTCSAENSGGRDCWLILAVHQYRFCYFREFWVCQFALNVPVFSSGTHTGGSKSHRSLCETNLPPYKVHDCGVAPQLRCH